MEHKFSTDDSGRAEARRWLGFAAIPLFVAAAAGYGCATAPVAEAPPPNAGDVGVSLLLPPPGATHLELASTQRFVYPNLIDPVAMPEYPPQLLPSRLPPATVCVEVDIGEDGGILAVRQRIDETCPPDASPQHVEFSASTIRAVRGWSYEPAYLCQAPEGFAGDDPCLADGMVERATPLRLSYAFRFGQRDGEALVERVD